MIYENCFEDMIESIPGYRKRELLLFLIENDSDLLNESGLLKNVINRLNLEFKNFLMEQNEEYLDYIKNEEESILERIPNKKEEYFAVVFEDVRHEQTLILLLSLTDHNILKQA